MYKTYNPQAIEQDWYDTWEKRGYFAPTGTGTPYSIMIPPPNVTGSLHMGHAFQDTIMDALTRYHRMKGDNTLWQAGTDHAGIATQMVVERQLAAKYKTRHELGREDFVAEVWKWKHESGGHITRQLRRMGASLDWSRERFTLDDELSESVREVFVRLYEEGLIYRGKRLVNWDPVLRTAVSDLEVISQEEDGFMWHLRYPLVSPAPGDPDFLVVATTRPYTMLGDTAVAVHPDDERYKHLIGKQVHLPLTGRTIPIIADDYVDPEFGTGCVKITPAHDFNDEEVGKRHNLASINILMIDASIDLEGSKYDRMDRFKALDEIIRDLQEKELIEKIQPHKLMVPRGDRTNSIIEPYLTNQWFVKVAPLAAPAIQAVENGDIRFVPENWSKTYFEWMRNIKDWCISRQIWWGHRIPAWYCVSCDQKPHATDIGIDELNRWKGLGVLIPCKFETPIVSILKPDTCPICNSKDFVQDDDVLDTWFSSALWPFSTLGWPEQTPELKTFYPTSVLVTGFDIIFFWVARMIMMGLKFAGDVPFREVYITGLVRDEEGQKMSKSKGNVLDPIDLIDGVDLESLIAKRTSGLMQPEMAKKIEKATRKQFPDGIPAYGTDALRFTFAALATQGRDIKFDTGRIEGYRNFCNKLWNAARYVLMNTEGHDCGQDDGEVHLSLADRWIIGRLQLAEQQVIQSIVTYRFDLAAQAIYEFTWNEYCDWYLEFSKTVLLSPDSSPASLRGTRRTLVRVLETLLRLAHPLLPFITEEIWQRVAPLAGKTGDSIMLQTYPVPQPDKIDNEVLAELSWVQTFILGVRNIRGEMNIAPGKPLPVLLQNGTPRDRVWLDNNRHYLMTLGRLESITWLAAEHSAPESAIALVGNMKLLIPLAGLIDKQAELTRLGKEIEKVRKDLARGETKLDNPDYVARAPATVVAEERIRVGEQRAAIERLVEQQLRMQSL